MMGLHVADDHDLKKIPTNLSAGCGISRVHIVGAPLTVKTRTKFPAHMFPCTNLRHQRTTLSTSPRLHKHAHHPKMLKVKWTHCSADFTHLLFFGSWIPLLACFHNRDRCITHNAVLLVRFVSLISVFFAFLPIYPLITYVHITHFYAT